MDTATTKRIALVILSGGQDSTTCLFMAKHSGKYDGIHSITFDYSQRHGREIAAARCVARMAGVESHTVVEIPGVLKGTSPLVSDNKLEQYDDMYSLPGGIEKTFVPLRNQLFITIAMNHAASIGASDVITGVCEEDYGGYPDCRAVFIDAIEKATNLGLTGHRAKTEPGYVCILTPLMKKTKAETCKLGYWMADCRAALAYTHTAYDGSYPPTGRDHATLLRAKGFLEANLPDPLVVRAWAEGRIAALPETSNYDEYRVCSTKMEL